MGIWASAVIILTIIIANLIIIIIKHQTTCVPTVVDRKQMVDQITVKLIALRYDLSPHHHHRYNRIHCQIINTKAMVIFDIFYMKTLL